MTMLEYKLPWTSAIVAVCVVLVGSLLVKVFKLYVRVYTTPLRRLDGPPMLHWFNGFIPPSMLQYQSDVIEEAHNKYGAVWHGVTVGRSPAISVGDDVAVQHIMKNRARYGRPRVQARATSMFIGDGLVNQEGANHRRQRHVAEPSFSDRSIQRATPLIFSVGERLMARWHAMVQSEPQREKKAELSINVQHEFALAALDVIGLAGFNHDFHALEDHLDDKKDSTAMHEVWRSLMQLSLSRSSYAVARALFPVVRRFGALFVPEEQKLLAIRSRVDGLVSNLVAQAKQEAAAATTTDNDGKGDGGKQTILARMVASNASGSKNALLDSDIHSMIPIFLAAGHETSGASLGWALFALTRDAKIHGTSAKESPQGWQKQQFLRQELLAEENQGWQNNFELLDRLPYLDAVAAETMRLFTPLRLFRKECRQDDVLPLGQPIRMRDGSMARSVVLSKGDHIIIPVHYLNKAERYWGEDGGLFKPERWLPKSHPLYAGGLPEEMQTRRKTVAWRSMFTFGQGTHACIGYRLAIAEFKILLAMTIAEFQVLPIEKSPDDKVVEITQRSVFVSRPEIKGGDGTFTMPCRLVPL